MRGISAAPGGVTVDPARDLAARLDQPLELRCFDAARGSFAAGRDGLADIGFPAVSMRWTASATGRRDGIPAPPAG